MRSNSLAALAELAAILSSTQQDWTLMYPGQALGTEYLPSSLRSRCKKIMHRSSEVVRLLVALDRHTPPPDWVWFGGLRIRCWTLTTFGSFEYPRKKGVIIIANTWDTHTIYLETYSGLYHVSISFVHYSWSPNAHPLFVMFAAQSRTVFSVFTSMETAKMIQPPENARQRRRPAEKSHPSNVHNLTITSSPFK